MVDDKTPDELMAEKLSEPQLLCLACGLCCDGTLFENVSLNQADAPEPLLAVGIRLEPQPEGARFTQPCAAHCGNRCLVYDHRPRTCRTYQCKLLKRLLSAEIGGAEAREIVRDTVQQRDELRQQMQAALLGFDAAAPANLSLRALFRRLREAANTPAAAAFRQRHQHLLLAYAVLQARLQRHFQEKKAARNSTG